MSDKKLIIWALGAIVFVVIVLALALKSDEGKNVDGESTTDQIEEVYLEGYVPEIEGVDIEVLVQGAGNDIVKKGDNLEVHYVGTLEDGTEFDSSVARGTPFSFQIGQGRVIQGWDQGLMGMKVGEKRKLTISPEMGYGDMAVGKIPANSTLIFEVELLGIE